MSMLDKSLDNLRRIAGAATRKTGVAVELSRLKLQAMQVNSMIQSTYERIGTLVYEQDKDGAENGDLIAICIREIDLLRADAADLNVRMAELKNGVRCPSCGGVNPSDLFYCKNCGVALSKRAPKR